MIDPRSYLTEETAKGGLPVTIRALRPDDRERMATAVRGLDPESIYLRLFSRGRELTEAAIDRIMRFDPEREVVLVATTGDHTRIIGSGRYILTHPGIPTVYYPHVYDFGLRDAIAVLMAIRRDHGLTSTSSVAIQRAEKNLYAALVDGKVAVKLGNKAWSPGTGWALAAKGTQYAVWVRSS